MENTGDQLKPNSILNKKVSRREALKGGAKVTVGVGALGSFGRLMRWIDNIRAPKWSPSSESLVLSQKLPDIAYKQPDSQTVDRPIIKDDKPQEPPEEPKVEEKKLTVKSEIEDLFPSYTGEEKDYLVKKVEEEVEYFKTKRYPNADSLDLVVTNTIRWKEKVDEIIKTMDLSDEFLKSKVPELLTSLIFVESEGLPDQVSPSGAMGLTQVMPKTAQEIAGKLGIDSYDLNDPDTAIRFELKYLSDTYDLFPEAGLTIWAYHLGIGSLRKVVNAKLGRDDIGFATVASEVKKNNLNLANLLNLPYTDEQVANGTFSDQTEYYATRIIAAKFFQDQWMAGTLKG